MALIQWGHVGAWIGKDAVKLVKGEMKRMSCVFDAPVLYPVPKGHWLDNLGGLFRCWEDCSSCSTAHCYKGMFLDWTYLVSSHDLQLPPAEAIPYKKQRATHIIFFKGQNASPRMLSFVFLNVWEIQSGLDIDTKYFMCMYPCIYMQGSWLWSFQTTFRSAWSTVHLSSSTGYIPTWVKVSSTNALEPSGTWAKMGHDDSVIIIQIDRKKLRNACLH